MDQSELDKYVCKEQDPATKSFFMQQTMIRVKDPRKSLDFYTRILGMKLLCKLDFPDAKFTLFFVGYVDDSVIIPEDPTEARKFALSQVGTVELTYNYGSEKDENFHYHNGNTQPQGFGHLGIAVPDLLQVNAFPFAVFCALTKFLTKTFGFCEHFDNEEFKIMRNINYNARNWNFKSTFPLTQAYALFNSKSNRLTYFL